MKTNLKPSPFNSFKPYNNANVSATIANANAKNVTKKPKTSSAMNATRIDTNAYITLLQALKFNSNINNPMSIYVKYEDVTETTGGGLERAQSMLRKVKYALCLVQSTKTSDDVDFKVVSRSEGQALDDALPRSGIPLVLQQIIREHLAGIDKQPVCIVDKSFLEIVEINNQYVKIKQIERLLIKSPEPITLDEIQIKLPGQNMNQGVSTQPANNAPLTMITLDAKPVSTGVRLFNTIVEYMNTSASINNLQEYETVLTSTLPQIQHVLNFISTSNPSEKRDAMIKFVKDHDFFLWTPIKYQTAIDMTEDIKEGDVMDLFLEYVCRAFFNYCIDNNNTTKTYEDAITHVIENNEADIAAYIPVLLQIINPNPPNPFEIETINDATTIQMFERFLNFLIGDKRDVLRAASRAILNEICQYLLTNIRNVPSAKQAVLIRITEYIYKRIKILEQKSLLEVGDLNKLPLDVNEITGEFKITLQELHKAHQLRYLTIRVASIIINYFTAGLKVSESFKITDTYRDASIFIKDKLGKIIAVINVHPYFPSYNVRKYSLQMKSSIAGFAVDIALEGVSMENRTQIEKSLYQILTVACAGDNANELYVPIIMLGDRHTMDSRDLDYYYEYRPLLFRDLVMNVDSKFRERRKRLDRTFNEYIAKALGNAKAAVENFQGQNGGKNGKVFIQGRWRKLYPKNRGYVVKIDGKMVPVSSLKTGHKSKKQKEKTRRHS